MLLFLILIKRTSAFPVFPLYCRLTQVSTFWIIVLLYNTIMAKLISTSITINATPEKVWAVLTGFDRYREWNPFITLIAGKVEAGKKITVRIEPPGAAGMTMKPTILAFTTNREFRWRGNLIIRGLFDGEHSFILTDHGNGTTTLTQSERFTGILIPLFTKLIDVNTTNGFRLMNEQLKLRAESI